MIEVELDNYASCGKIESDINELSHYFKCTNSSTGLGFVKSRRVRVKSIATQAGNSVEVLALEEVRVFVAQPAGKPR